MKTFITAFALLLSASSIAQGQFNVTIEGDTKILRGIINRTDISSDSSFAWFGQNQKGYTPNARAVTSLKEKGNQIQIIAFGGTWCEDTRSIFPKFFSILDAAGFSDKRLTLLGVDRNKKTLGNLSEALNVEYVPTFIVMKDGKEVGRVVEYGKTGAWDKELGDIINTAK